MTHHDDDPTRAGTNPTTWVDCSSSDGVHHFAVNEHFAKYLVVPSGGPTHLLVCSFCGMHLHADVQVAPRQEPQERAAR